ncbi:hypothetical protein F5Y18DRAFT_443762 [Xylariaceae sp. FL1019]|nr:hypothetical protein F5Y18DRAFT_443762 [Xylariaceae sp. FL1019]
MASQQFTGPNIIEALSVELCHMIILDSGLHMGDLKRLRLTCRTFALLTAPRVFRAVGVSASTNGSYNLFRIAMAPHLAPFVREVVWHETDPDENHVVRFRDPPISTDQARSNAASIIAGFSLDWFIATILKLPNLRTFRVETFHWDDEELGFPSLSSPGQRVRVMKYNAGLLLFVLPAMRHSQTKITSLFVRGNTTISPILRLRPGDSLSLVNLTTLELCVGFFYDRLDKEMRDGLAILAAATNLRRLTLCFSRCEGYLGGRHYSQFLEALESLDCFPHLASFSLRRYRAYRVEQSLEQSAPILPLRNTESLRCLEFLDSHLQLQDVVELRNRGLSLDSITVQQHPVIDNPGFPQEAIDSTNGIKVTEADLLAFLNQEPYRFPIIAHELLLVASELSPTFIAPGRITDIENCSVYTVLDKTRCSDTRH